MLNGFSVEYEPLNGKLEHHGELVDKESMALNAQLIKNLEPQAEKLHEIYQMGEAMKRTLCNLSSQILKVNLMTQLLNSKRTELLQRESDDPEQDLEELRTVIAFVSHWANCRWKTKSRPSKKAWTRSNSCAWRT